MNIGDALKRLRKKRKLSQQQLARKLNVTQGFLSLMEKNKKEPTAKMIEKFSRELKIPKELIFLLACENSNKYKNFSKPLKRIAQAIDDMLLVLDE